MLITFVLFLVTLSSAICVTIRNEVVTNVILSNTMSVIALLSGVMFPIASLGEAVDRISNLSPMRWVLESVFELIYDGYSANYFAIIIGLVLLSAVLVAVVHNRYRPEDYV